MGLQVMNFKVEAAEKAMIERAAKKEGMSVSEYIRYAIYFERTMAVDVGALKLLGRRLRGRVFEKFQQLQKSAVTERSRA